MKSGRKIEDGEVIKGEQERNMRNGRNYERVRRGGKITYDEDERKRDEGRSSIEI